MGIVGCESAAAVHDAAAALVARARRAAQVAHSSQGLSLIDARCNAVERSVLHQLKRCLEDVDIAWHEVHIAARARQPDLVILNPCWGPGPRLQARLRRHGRDQGHEPRG